VCLIARHLEAHGIPTLCLASALDIIEAGRPPRALFVDYPLGHTAGRPFDAANQREILDAAVDAFASVRTPGEVVHLSCRWSDSDAWKASATDPEAGDVRSPRDTTPRYQEESDRLAAEVAAASGDD